MKARNSIDSHKFPDFMTGDASFRFHRSEHMTVVSCEKPTHILAGNYSHLNYEFFMAISDIDGLMIEDHAVSIPAGMICPIFSCQPHGASQLVSDVRFISIQFERRFFEKLIHMVHHDRHVTFHNGLFAATNGLKQLIDAFVQEQDSSEAGTRAMLEGVAMQTGVWLLRKLATVHPDERQGRLKSRRIDAIIQTLENDFEGDFSLSRLSQSAHVNKYTLIGQFKNHTGMTPYEFYQNHRILKALDLLKDTDQKIIEIADHCGFKNHSHFSRVFRARTGLTPSEYRKRHR